MGGGLTPSLNFKYSFMKSTKNFNNISDKLKAEIPKLKPGQKVSFQMLNGVPNPEPDPREKAKQGAVLYGKVQLMTFFRIFDKHQKDSEGNEVGGYVDVGCVDQWDGDKPARYRRFIPGISGVHLHNLAYGGRFDLVGGKVADEELFETLYLSPEREGSPCPDQSFEIKFRIIDEKAGTQATINRFDKLKRALGILDAITKPEAESIMAALNQPKYQDEQVLMAKLKEFALSNVDSFIKTYDSKETPVKTTIKKAIEEKVLEYSLKTGEVKVGGAEIVTLKASHIEGFINAFVNWIDTAENGKDVYKSIKSQLDITQDATA
jgi:hypothetical protein